MHHAWLLTGPEGIGKATFAYRAARRLLGAAADERYGLLGASPEDPVSRLISARSHPDLMVLERAVEDGKTKKYISVDEARALPGFFAKSPSMSRYRVAIVDAVDDMNINAANALLKTLEEPPQRGVLFLISHAPGRLMATIRSRCRRLGFAPWPEPDVATFVSARTGASEPDASALAAMARGAPGRALCLAGGPAADFDAAARALVAGAWPSDSVLLHFADGFRGNEGAVRFELMLDRLAEAIRRRATVAGAIAPDLWGRMWERTSSAWGESDAINLDRADVFWTLLADLKALRATSDPGENV